MRVRRQVGADGVTYGRRDFVEFGDVYAMRADFAAEVEAEFGRLVGRVIAGRAESATQCGVDRLPS